MKKILFSIVIILCSVLAFAQTGSADIRSFVSGGSSSDNISRSIGLIFYDYAPDAAPIVTEGIQQSYLVDTYDTLLCHIEDLPTGLVAGDNEIEQTDELGYDELLHKRVYTLDCSTSPDLDSTMVSPGLSTCAYTLPTPTLNPIDGEVTLSLTTPSSNPYNFPVPSTTTAVWTASVADTAITCEPVITIRPYICPPTVTTDGYTYPVAGLTYNCWTTENLRAKHYADGTTAIPNVMTYATTDFADVESIFGNLYTWDAATNYHTNTNQGICPDGWHIPSNEDWQNLYDNYSIESLTGTDYWIPVPGTNSSLFNALPSGLYNAQNGAYENLRVMSFYWTSTIDGVRSIACTFGTACGTTEALSYERNYGFSVRCIMDSLY